MSLKKKRVKVTTVSVRWIMLVQLNAVTALLASDQLPQPNPVVPFPSDVQVHPITHVISAPNIHLEGHSQPQHASVQTVVPAGSLQPPPVATGANLRHWL